MKYKEYKQYFIDNLDSLPKTLGNDFIFISDVKGHIENTISLIENQLRLHGKKCNEIPYSISLLSNLKTAHNLMQKKENQDVKGLTKRKHC